MKVRDYKDLDVWKKGVEIVELVYDITSEFPSNEKFGLAAHMHKTAVSIPSNVAEGFMRQHSKEYKQFLHISLGSCAELETQEIIAKKRNYSSDAYHDELLEHIDHECRMLMNLIKSLRD